jgi:LmbE family N-acetylglucosaminyl deacetylase
MIFMTKANKLIQTLTVVLCLCILLTGCGFPITTATPMPTANILIFAPHPDDETFCCAAIIQQALAERKRVHVVIFTNGDGFPKAASDLTRKHLDLLTPQDYLELSRVRQTEALSAAIALGLQAMDLTFLGYPDAGLDKVYRTQAGASFQQPFTQKSETYGLAVSDYHSRVYGTPAPYQRKYALADVTKIVQDFKPEQVYAPNAVDTHPDHQATFWFVRDALQAISYQGHLYTYVIHATSYPCPESLPCPPTLKKSPSKAQSTKKFEALLNYKSQVWQFFDSVQSLEAYTQEDEAFWFIDLKLAAP